MHLLQPWDRSSQHLNVAESIVDHHEHMFTHWKHRQPSLPTLLHHPVSRSLFQVTLRRNLLHLDGVISCETIVSNHLPFQSSDNQMLWYDEECDLAMSCGRIEHAILPSTWASLILIHIMHRTLTIQHSHPLSLVQELWIHVPRLFLHYQQHLPLLCLTNPKVCWAQTNNPDRFACIFLLGPAVALGSELHIYQLLWWALQWSAALWASVITSWCIYTRCNAANWTVQ